MATDFDPLKKQTSRYLLTSDYLKVITIAGHSSNLSLTTSAWVNTITNTATVAYSVNPWNDKLKRLTKEFTIYDEAYAYYMKVYKRFEKIYPK
jgi:hypothetical protein